MSSPVIFFDKDGTLIENVPYNVDPARVKLATGAVEGLRLLRDTDFRFAVVSNQSGVARGFFPEDALKPVGSRLRELFSDIGLSLAGFFYCPHHPSGSVRKYTVNCDCRKPAPGLLLTAARELRANLCECWMIGDILDDVEAGRRAGCRTVLIDNGNETEWRSGPFREPHFRAKDLYEAARVIVKQSALCPERERW